MPRLSQNALETILKHPFTLFVHFCGKYGYIVTRRLSFDTELQPISGTTNVAFSQCSFGHRIFKPKESPAGGAAGPKRIFTLFDETVSSVSSVAVTTIE